MYINIHLIFLSFIDFIQYHRQEFPEMQPEYKILYHSRRISERKLLNRILNIYKDYDCDHPYNYDQLLFIFDLKCPPDNPKSNRQICHELYRQTCDLQGKTTIRLMVQLYIQNVETAKVSLLRDEFKINKLRQKQGQLVRRNKTFVYLKVIQASVYARFSDNNLLTYRISPSNIPPISLQNTINNLFNHEFTLQLEQPYFTIDFYQSGIQIYSWTFPDQKNLQQGEYQRLIKCQNIDFQVKLKYLPKDSISLKKNLQKQINQQQKIMLVSKQVFFKLCDFNAFRHHSPKKTDTKQQSTFMEQLFSFLPFLKSHVQNLYYLLLFFILVQCLASYYVSIQFVDIILAFYTIGLFFDQSIVQYGMKIIVLIFSFGLCIIKTFWGLNTSSFYVNHNFQVPVLILCIILKLLIILFIAISLHLAHQIPEQRRYLYLRAYNDQFHEIPKQLQTDNTSIWESAISS